MLAICQLVDLNSSLPPPIDDRVYYRRQHTAAVRKGSIVTFLAHLTRKIYQWNKQGCCSSVANDMYLERPKASHCSTHLTRLNKQVEAFACPVPPAPLAQTTLVHQPRAINTTFGLRRRPHAVKIITEPWLAGGSHTYHRSRCSCTLNAGHEGIGAPRCYIPYLPRRVRRMHAGDVTSIHGDLAHRCMSSASAHWHHCSFTFTILRCVHNITQRFANTSSRETHARRRGRGKCVSIWFISAREYAQRVNVWRGKGGEGGGGEMGGGRRGRRGAPSCIKHLNINGISGSERRRRSGAATG